MKTVTLKPQKAKPFWFGNPLVFSGALTADHEKMGISAGELVNVHDANGQLVGVGAFNPFSSYRVRLFVRATDNLAVYTLSAILAYRIEQAIQLRSWLNLPNQETDCYRLINSEGDNLSGLTVDVYGDYCVVAPTAYWAMKNRELINQLLDNYLLGKTILWRPEFKSLAQDGWHENEREENEARITICESNLRYHFSLAQGQKTGFYFDQRDNRLLAQQLAYQRRVLDVCCYMGAFSMQAAIGGAKSVMGVDSSEWAIETAKQNAILNGLENRISWRRADALTVLQEKPDVDFIILDPPKLAPSHKHVKKALSYYRSLNQAAMMSLQSGGLLLTCTCSSAIVPMLFYSMLGEAALSASKSIKILTTTRAAACHPVLPGFLEADYLHAVLLAVM